MLLLSKWTTTISQPTSDIVVAIIKIDVISAAGRSDAMLKMKAVIRAELVTTCLGAHLRDLYAVPIVVAAIVSAATYKAVWLKSIGVRMLLEFSPGSASSAAAVGFHGIALPISNAAKTIERLQAAHGSSSYLVLVIFRSS